MPSDRIQFCPFLSFFLLFLYGINGTEARTNPEQFSPSACNRPGGIPVSSQLDHLMLLGTTHIFPAGDRPELGPGDAHNSSAELADHAIEPS